MDKGVIGVIGAGAMGTGIAQVAAAAGHAVVLGDANDGMVAKAQATIVKNLERDVEKGRLEPTDAATISGRITDGGSLLAGYASFASCSVVIEAVIEDLAVKRNLMRELEQVVSGECILGTNTSSLSVAALAGGCTNRERLIGIHFFNPATLMPLVEIVPAITTSPAVAGSAVALVRSWGKTTVTTSDTPGFLVNRIARPFYGESLRQLEEGVADIATIDWAMRELGGFRMGPFELMDFIGNDVNFAVTTSVFEAFFYDARYRPALTQRRLVEAGLFGRKAGRGYYSYANNGANPEPNTDRKLGQAILDRTLAMLVNEAVDAVFMGVGKVLDIELAMTKGVNYPKGLLAWGDEIGAGVILSRLDRLYAEYGEDRYRASPLLRRRVAAGAALLS